MRKAMTAVVCTVCLSGNALAQTQRSGDNNARAMQQVQQLSVERAQLKAENEKLKKAAEDLKQQLASNSGSQTSLQAKLKAAETAAAQDAASNRQNAEALEKARAQMQEVITRFRETAATLKDVETDRNLLRSQLQVRDRDLNACIDRNASLYDLNKEVLDRYERKGMWSSLAEKEPFTKIQRTRLENLIDDYRERAKDLRLQTQTK